MKKKEEGLKTGGVLFSEKWEGQKKKKNEMCKIVCCCTVLEKQSREKLGTIL